MSSYNSGKNSSQEAQTVNAKTFGLLLFTYMLANAVQNCFKIVVIGIGIMVFTTIGDMGIVT